MKKIIIVTLGSLFSVILLSSCVNRTGDFADKNAENNFTEGETRANQFEAPDLKFKKIAEKGVYENENVKFDLNFESPLAAVECGPKSICIYNELSSRKSLEEAPDFQIDLHLNNESDDNYDKHLSSLVNQSFTMGEIDNPKEYFFSKADSAREKEIAVQLVKYPSDIDVYFLYWENLGKKNYVTIRDNKFDFPKHSNDLDAIIQTIELK